MWACPVCGRKNIGKVAADQFYCWDCFIEFSLQGTRVKVFEVAEDGSLVDYVNESQSDSTYAPDSLPMQINTIA